MRTSLSVMDEVLEQQARQEEAHGTYPPADTVMAEGVVADALYRPFTGDVWTDPDDMREAR